MVFSNDYKYYFNNIDKLPEVLVDIIHSYIPKKYIFYLTKQNYTVDHHLIRQFINKTQIEQYIRAMVKDDNNFVFKHLLVENYKRWLNMTNYYYKECIYGNYLYFLKSYAIDNEAIKCSKLIIELFEEEGLSKNQHKKNINKYIRWKT